MSGGSNPYKPEDNQNSRTEPVVKRVRTQIGELEYRILSYVVQNNLKRVTVSELSSELHVDKRRVWDALQRLIRRGIANKIDRGLYEIDREKAHVLIQLYEHRNGRSGSKDSDVQHAARATANTMHRATVKSKTISSSRMDQLCCDMVRIHVRVASSDGILFVHRVIEYAYYLIMFAKNFIRQYLRELGFSRSAIKRFISAALDRIERFMQSIQVFFGVHGIRKYRANGEDITVNLGSKEIGMDIVSNSGYLEKFFIKIYSTKSSKAANRKLTDYLHLHGHV